MKEDHASLPALMLRLAVGPTMFAHGYNKVFGGGGLEGTERWFHGIGFRPAAVHRADGCPHRDEFRRGHHPWRCSIPYPTPP